MENRAFRKKRSDEEVVKKEEEDIEAIFNSVESSCSTKFWRCVSNVIEGGLHYTEMPGGLTGAMKKHLMKVVFAGGISNMWDSLMTVPEVRNSIRCQLHTIDDVILYLKGEGCVIIALKAAYSSTLLE